MRVSCLLRPVLVLWCLSCAAYAADGDPHSQMRSHAHGTPQGSTAVAHLHAPPEFYDLVAALRRGGYVIFMRHGRTAIGETDTPGVDFADCAAQRNLSPGGVLASREMGEALVALRIPIGRVAASPYCRTMATAREAFGRVHADADLLASPDIAAQAGRKLLEKLALPPEAGTNTFLVGHVFNALPALGVMLEEGESAVTFVDHAGKLRLAGRVPQLRWGDLARDFRSYGDGVFAMAAAMRLRHAGTVVREDAATPRPPAHH